MSMLLDVVKNKSNREKRARQRKNDEVRELKKETMYRARLTEDFKGIAMIFKSEDIASVNIEVSDDQLSLFLKAIYSEEFADYNIIQMEENIFKISRKAINF